QLVDSEPAIQIEDQERSTLQLAEFHIHNGAQHVLRGFERDIHRVGFDVHAWSFLHVGWSGSPLRGINGPGTCDCEHDKDQSKDILVFHHGILTTSFAKPTFSFWS